MHKDLSESIWYKSLEKESDRGAAVIGAGLLDELLKDLLMATFVDENELCDERDLGSFYTRIKLVYSLGFIGAKTYNDLEIIRKIRNEFAHNHYLIDFDNQKINDLVKNIQYTAPKNSHASKHIHPFIFSVTIMASRLEKLIKKQKHASKGKDIEIIGKSISCARDRR